MAVLLLLLSVFLIAALPELFSIRLGQLVLNPLVPIQTTRRFVERVVDSFTPGSASVFDYLAGQTERNFLQELGPYFGNSLKFLLGGLVIGIGLGIALGILTGRRNLRRLEHFVGTIGVVPDFMLALVLQLIVIGITAATGVRVAYVAAIGSGEALLLPLIVMSLYPMVTTMLITSDRIQFFRGEQFVVNLLARGVDSGRIYRVHLFPGIVRAIRTELPRILGTHVATLFVVERIFQIKGIVRWMFTYMFLERGALQLAGYQFDFTVLCLLALIGVVLISLIVVRLLLELTVLGLRYV